MKIICHLLVKIRKYEMLFINLLYKTKWRYWLTIYLPFRLVLVQCILVRFGHILNVMKEMFIKNIKRILVYVYDNTDRWTYHGQAKTWGTWTCYKSINTYLFRSFCLTLSIKKLFLVGEQIYTKDICCTSYRLLLLYVHFKSFYLTKSIK